MQKALNNLKQDDSIMILPADKVVLNTDTYHDKMKTLIETGPYQLLNKDPTDRLSRKLTEKLLSLKRSGHLSETVYNKIKPRHKEPPRIYGQPKTHKPEIPLRPIVSCVNTFAYDLSAHLADILSPLTGKSDYTVTNSSHFVSTICHERHAHAPSAVLVFSNRFSVWTGENDSKTLRVEANFFETERKKFVFKQKRTRVNGALPGVGC